MWGEIFIFILKVWNILESLIAFLKHYIHRALTIFFKYTNVLYIETLDFNKQMTLGLENTSHQSKQDLMSDMLQDRNCIEFIIFSLTSTRL